MEFPQEEILFPNATPSSLDNFEHKAHRQQNIQEGVTLQNDADLNKAMSSLMTEYVKDTQNSNRNSTSNKNNEGFLTGTSLNLNLLQGDLMNYGRYDLDKNPIQPFTDRIQESF